MTTVELPQPKRRPKFDWDEARRLRFEQGMSYEYIAWLLDVTEGAVRRVCDPEVYAAMREQTRLTPEVNRRLHTRLCPCGRGVRWQMSSCCRRCADEAKITSVRADTLRCSVCREWKPDKMFSPRPSAPARRGRAQECLSCCAARKREARRRARFS